MIWRSSGGGDEHPCRQERHLHSPADSAPRPGPVEHLLERFGPGLAATRRAQHDPRYSVSVATRMAAHAVVAWAMA